MIVIAAARLFRTVPGLDRRRLHRAGRACRLGRAARPTLAGELGNLNLLLFFVGLVGASVLAGVPISIAFALLHLRLPGA